MSKKGETVRVAFANLQPENIPLATVKEWETKNISRIGSSVFFSVEGQYASMKTADYNKIFG